MEIWKDIKGYEELYQASSLGRIRTHENKTTYTERHGDRKWKQRIMKYRGYTPKTGYRVSLWKDGKTKDFLVARLIAFTFLDGDISNPKLTVNHINGDRMDNRIENLELISLADNIRHGFDNGLYPSCKKTTIYNLESGEEQTFRSMSLASKYLAKCVGFISELCKKNNNNIVFYGDYKIIVERKQSWNM